MKYQVIVLCAAVAVSFLINSCAPNLEHAANEDFYNRNYDAAIRRYRKLVEKKYEEKDINYIIYLMNYGLLNYYAGYFEEARKTFWSAYKIQEGETPQAYKAAEWLKSSEKRIYRLKKREDFLLHFYLGMSFLYTNKTDDALIEFKKLRILEEQKPRVPLISFYMAKIYEILDEYEDAIIEYKNLIELTKKDPFPPVYFLLAKNYSLQGDTQKSNETIEILKKADSLTPGAVYSSIVKPEDAYELIIQIDQDMLLEYSNIYADGKYVGTARLIDVFKPGVSAGEFARKAIKEATSLIAREGTKKGITVLFEKLLGEKTGKEVGEDIGEGLLGGEKKDKRSWFYAPQGFSLFVGQTPKKTKRIRIKFFGHKEFFGSRHKEEGSITYYLDEKPSIKIGNQVFLTVRYQSRPYRRRAEDWEVRYEKRR